MYREVLSFKGTRSLESMQAAEQLRDAHKLHLTDRGCQSSKGSLSITDLLRSWLTANETKALTSVVLSQYCSA
jgi:hypothetical protein